MQLMGRRRRGKKTTTTAALVVAILIGGYSLIRPAVNEATGWNLPAVGQASQTIESEDSTRVPQSWSRNTTIDANPSGADLQYGILKEISPNRYRSPAGLLYTPGSSEGHRLEHLRRHTADMPGRSGKHGVFDGGMPTALQVIDQAYQNAVAGIRTTESTDQGRTIYTVDMGTRIGFIGGREGNRRRKPMARRVRLVLDGDRLITAFPM